MFVGAFQLFEGRFNQRRSSGSAPDALYVQSDAVPANKIWTILAISYWVSAAETRKLFLERVNNNGRLAITLPASIEITIENKAGFITPGNELILFPGERVRVNRDVATAGSTMNIDMIIVETDLPFYRYSEPQRELSRKRRGTGFAGSSSVGGARSMLGSDEGGDVGSGAPGGGGPREEPV